MTPRKPLTACALALLIAPFTGCGGGGDAPAGSTTTLTITPSLGKITGAEVRVYAPDGTDLGHAVLGADGTVSIDPGKALPDGFVVKVFGKAGATYFDEALGADRPFPDGSVLSAAGDGGSRRITVSALTTVAYERARSLAGSGALTRTLIRQANSEIAAALAGDSVTDITAPVATVGSADDRPDPESPEGRHAYLLAAVADYAASRQPDCNSDCDPLLDTVSRLAEDLSDGVLDGKHGDAVIGSTYYLDGETPAAAVAALKSNLKTRRDRFAETGFTRTARWLARTLKGEYPLHCTTALAETGEPNGRLVIGAGGGWLVEGPWGALTLGDRSAALLWDQQDSDPAKWLLGRSRERWADNGAPIQTATQSAHIVNERIAQSLMYGATCTSAVKRNDGISIGVGSIPPICVNLDIPRPQSRLTSVSFDGNGAGHVLTGIASWSCTGFPSFPAQDRVVLEKRVREWLPDGAYTCRTAQGNADDPVTVKDGKLSSGGLDIDLASLTRPRELQRDPDDEGMVLNENLSVLLLGDDTPDYRKLDSAEYLDAAGATRLTVHRAGSTRALAFSFTRAVPDHPELSFTRTLCHSPLPPH